MLSLISENATQTDPNLAVRWCMDKEDLIALKDEEANHIHIFFVVVYENGKEDRSLVPMDELMTYLPLRFPGEHLILAAVVWKESEKVSDWLAGKKSLLKKFNRDEYNHPILNERRDEIDLYDLARALDEHGHAFNRNLTAALRVNVPEEFFPKEPPAWVKRWVNVGCEYDFADQCQFRKRAAYAFTLKPLFVAFYLVWRPIFGALVALYYFGLGFRGVNLSVLWHPWRTSLDELYIPRNREYRTFQLRHSSWFMEYADGRKKSKAWWLLSPFVPGLALLLLETASRWTGMTYFELVRYVFATLQALPGALWFLVALIATVTTCVLLLARSVNNYRTSKQQQEALPEAQERKRQEQEEAERLAFEEKLNVLTCERVPKRRPSVEDIPPQYRTVRLRFLELKALVCRPFAGH